MAILLTLAAIKRSDRLSHASSASWRLECLVRAHRRLECLGASAPQRLECLARLGASGASGASCALALFFLPRPGRAPRAPRGGPAACAGAHRERPPPLRKASLVVPQTFAP